MVQGLASFIEEKPSIIEDKLGKNSPAQASKILRTDSGNCISSSKGTETTPSLKDLSAMQPNMQEDIKETLAHVTNILRESLFVDDGGVVFLEMINPRVSNPFSSPDGSEAVTETSPQKHSPQGLPPASLSRKEPSPVPHINTPRDYRLFN